MVVVPGLVVDEHRAPIVLPQQIALGQRRSLVRKQVLVAHQDDRACVAEVAQRFRGLGSGEAGADDDNGLGIGHPVILAPRPSEATPGVPSSDELLINLGREYLRVVKH